MLPTRRHTAQVRETAVGSQPSPRDVPWHACGAAERTDKQSSSLCLLPRLAPCRGFTGEDPPRSWHSAPGCSAATVLPGWAGLPPRPPGLVRVPLCVYRSTSTVGFPRESRISRAWILSTAMVSLWKGQHRGGRDRTRTRSALRGATMWCSPVSGQGADREKGAQGRATLGARAKVTGSSKC